MSNRVKRNILVAVAVTLLAVAAFEVLSYAQDQDKVVAIVNKDIITRKDLNDFLNFMAIQLSAKFSQAEAQEKIDAAQADILNRLIEDKLILQEAKNEKVIIDENRVKGKIEQLRLQYPSGRDYENAIMQQGLTPADVENKIREQMQIYAIIEEKIKNRVVVDPAEVTNFYKEHEAEMTEPEGRKVSALIVNDPKIAAQVLDFINKGGSLDDAAKKYELNLQDLGIIHKGQSRKEIEEAIFKLKSQEVSGVVKLDEDKYYILKAQEVLEPKRISLDDARDKIADMLYQGKMQEALTKWIDELKEKYYVEIKQN